VHAATKSGVQDGRPGQVFMFTASTVQ